MKHLFLTIGVLVGFVAMGATANETPEEKKPEAKTVTADTNEDGKVSKEEFVAHAKKNAEEKGVEFNQKRAENIFEKKDTDKDGFLTIDDVFGKPAPANETPEAKTRTADTNQDGKVSKEEYVALAKKNAEKKGVEFNQKRAESIFAKKDTNQDGFLTAEDVAMKKALKKEEGEAAAEQ